MGGRAVYVTPKMGGGQQNAPMVMPNVRFDGAALSVTGVLDMTGMPIVDAPVLRPLSPPDEFEAGKPWSALSGYAYNLQYGWNLDPGSAFLPAGGNIWIERTAATPGLLAYERGTYAPIFGTEGSPAKWLWDGVMAHNAYAVPAVPGTWSAAYRLYVGDAGGIPLPGYGEANLTLSWTSIPEPVGLSLVAGAALMRRPRRRWGCSRVTSATTM